MARANDGTGMQDGGQQVGAENRSWRSKARPYFSSLDLLACCVLVAFAAWAFGVLPDGAPLRVALAYSVLFFAPGYLLIEAAAGPARTTSGRVARAFLAIGVTPTLVGLLALATSLFPGGFKPAAIVTLLTVASFALGTAALWRRMVPAQHTSPDLAVA